MDEDRKMGTLREKLFSEQIRLRGKDGNDYLIRPIRPADAPLLVRAYDALPERSKWLRLLHTMPHLSEEMAAEFCNSDPETSVSTVIEGIGGLAGEIVGGARVVDIAAGQPAEFAVTLRSEAQGLGLARQALEILITIAREAGCASMWGVVAASNNDMLALARKLGFSIRRDPDDMSLKLAEISFQGKSKPGHSCPSEQG